MASNGAPTKRGKYQRHTNKEKKAALEEAAKIGINPAARKHGIPASTLGHWLKLSKAAAPALKVDGPPPAVAQTQPAKVLNPSSETLAGPMLPPEANQRRVAKVYTPSQRAEILEYTGACGVKAASKKFAVSRFTIYDWKHKVERAAAGKGVSPTCGPAPQEIEAQRDREILNEWHLHPGLGPSQIRNQLRRKSIKVSVHTTRRVMEDAGYRPPKVRRQEHNERFNAVRPNHLWHLDYLHRDINRASTHTLIILDDCSRYSVGHGVDDAERADLVIDTFEEAVRRHGKPEMVLHDKGSAFWAWRGISRFTTLLTELGIDQIAADFKEWNGKLEVFNANLSKELFDVYHFYDLAEMRRRLAAHLHWYNHQRTSHALGGLLAPADRYYGRAEEVLARIEAGTGGREGFETLDLRDRCLELFKVISKNGRPEVWLMGQKIFELP
ncbi:MAG: DDE-type integrase/transposase/recombinase [Desulfovibrio sp.]|nr:DDE-type integrase/transposase/recombinase [Desulfovibrio sp.]